jgi:hypothetical protein
LEISDVVQGLVFVLVLHVSIKRWPSQYIHVNKTIQAVSEQEIFQGVLKKNVLSKTDFLEKLLNS